MDFGPAGNGAAAGGIIYLAGRLIEKLPWGKMFGRNGKNGSASINEDRVKVIVSEHKDACLGVIREDIQRLETGLYRKHDEMQATITAMLLKGRD